MGFIQNIIKQHKEKVKVRNEECDQLISKIDVVLQEVTNLFLDSQSFVDPREEIKWKNNHSTLLTEIDTEHIRKLKKASHYKILLTKQEELFKNENNLKQKIRDHNNMVADNKIKETYTLIGNVEGKKMDKQQMSCIVKDTYNHLVIAGAGTGKTTTIVGKIKYLLKSGKYKPEDILVLSFTNASASEMSQRINRETGCYIEALTFHKLGLNILTKVNGVIPRISQLNLRKFIKEQLKINMESDDYLNLLSTYLLFNRTSSKSEFDFKTIYEYEDYLKYNPPKTVRRENVKSYGEMDIANFLIQNKVHYIYEAPYKIDTSTDQFRQYYPDFYLPEYDIYIEYFAVNKNGEVPSYFKSRDGMTPTQTYQESIKWKRKIHKQYKTTMIECYAYEKFEDSLLENLKAKLIENDVKLVPMSALELWEQVASKGDSILDGIIELFETVINLIKSNGYSISDVRAINVNNSNVRINDIILDLLEPIFNSYCFYLKENNVIDFNDMINLATECIEQNKYTTPYKCVIIDEYQDISKARFSLLNSMRKSSDYNLFCVGDDWQSIYRFAGSDIGFILNFEHYWGPSEINKIETTYRFSQKLIDISSDFIMKNPMQIRKSIEGKNDLVGFALGEINGYNENYSIEFMIKKLDDLPKDSTVFFIGRYLFDGKLLSNNRLLECKYNNINGIVDVKYHKRPDLKMRFITAHKSKGLQADFVFIINNKNSRMGFPSKMQDAPILDLLLDNCDQYPYAEERRLYYVALTRAKKKVFIVTVKNKVSEFAMELKHQYRNELKHEQFECPLCGGQLLRKSGPYGEFFGCSNYKVNGCRYKRTLNNAN